MNRSYSKIRHIQESNHRLENRLLNEMDTDIDTSRFKSLLESTLGDVKPLVNEQAETKVAGPIGLPPIQYYIYNIKNPSEGDKFYIYQTNATQKTPILMQGTQWNNNGQGYDTQDKAEEIVQKYLPKKPSSSNEPLVPEPLVPQPEL